MIAGFLYVDKPVGITSHDVIDKIRKITDIKKVGHGGTLDPNASGLLIVGVGKPATKRLSEFTTKKTKTYTAEIYLGETRDTDDSEGKVVKSTNISSQPSSNDINNALKRFKGELLQTPPQFSAIKKGGKKAYEVARKGGKIKLEPRKINIYEIKLIKYDFPILEINCSVSSGTYIRALARDIGEFLETGAYLKELRRTSIGDVNIKDATKLSEINDENWQKLLKNI